MGLVNEWLEMGRPGKRVREVFDFRDARRFWVVIEYLGELVGDPGQSGGDAKGAALGYAEGQGPAISSLQTEAKPGLLEHRDREIGKHESKPTLVRHPT